MRKSFFSISLVVCICCGTAFAQKGSATGTESTDVSPRADQVERLHVEGAALYRAGAYREAITKFESAYAIFPEPNILYNLGRCFQALGEVDQAIEYYRRCAQHPDVTEVTRQKARAKLDILSKADTKAIKKGIKGDTTTTSGSGAVSPATTVPTKQQKIRKGANTPAWIGLGITAAFVVATGVIGVMALNAQSDVDTELKRFPGDRDAIDDAQSRVDELALTADIIGGTAIAAACVTLYLFLRSGGSSEKANSGSDTTTAGISIVPGSGAVFHGQF